MDREPGWKPATVGAAFLFVTYFREHMHRRNLQYKR